MLLSRHRSTGPALLTLLLTAAACHHKAPEPPRMHERLPNHTVALHGAAAAFVSVEPAAPVTQSSERSLIARITFDDRHVAMIGPPVQGRVANVNVIVGDHVERNQILLTIHAPEVASASAQVAQAHTARMLAERTAERAQMLAAQGAGSDAERLQSQAALLQARTEEARAIASLNAIGGMHGSSDYELRSPIAGSVVERNVAVGTEVHADQDRPVIIVADLSTVWVEADVFEQDLSRVRVNDDATIEVVAFPGRQFRGRITYVGNTVDPQTRVSHARIELPNPDRALRPGMFARVRALGQSEGAVEIPMSAVLARRDQFFVFVRNADGSYTQREVRRGEQHGQHVAILSGLHLGEPVVTEGAILLDAEANEAL